MPSELCARCGAALRPPIPARCPLCEGPPQLAGRYALLEVLGRSAERTTYRARRLEDGVEVAIKELSFRRMASWKSEELFAREIRILRELSHPAVPRLFDTLAIEDGARSGLYLVRELVDGCSLEAEMRARRHTRAEAQRVAAELLDIVADLHALSPPLVHRDLTLSNVLRRADGRLVLVDLGAVRDTLAAASGGSTLVGTYGYAAPEQLRGVASAASDVYAVGAITLALLARRPADALLDARHRFRVADHAEGELRRVLERMLAPQPERRPSAKTAARQMRRLTAGRPATSRAPLALSLVAALFLVTVVLAAASSAPASGSAAVVEPHEPALPESASAAPPSGPAPLPPAPIALPTIPFERDPPTPIEPPLGWTPECETRGGCASVSASFAGITLWGQCAPLLGAADAPAESMASVAVERTIGGVALSCRASQQHGSFCNVLCEAPSTDAWADAEAIVRWIGDRHGRPTRAEESTASSGPFGRTRRRATTFRSEGSGTFGPEVLVLADRRFVDGGEPEPRRERVVVSYRGPFTREGDQ